MVLTLEHIEDFKRSGLTDSTIEKLRFEAVRPHEIKLRGVESAVRIPYWNIDGSVNCFERWKVFPPITTADGHTQKYYQKPESVPHLYLPPCLSWSIVAKSADREIHIAEGEKKSAASCQRGDFCIGVAGVWNWRQRLESGDRIVIPTLDLFVWKGRSVVLIPDSDGWREDKWINVLSGFYALGQELISRGATVTMLRLPERHNVKVGLDDWYVAAGDDWEHQWKHLEQFSLDDERLAPVAAWWQKWREKQATLAAVSTQDLEEITLEETAGLYTVRVPRHHVVLTFDRLQETRGAIHTELSVTLGTTVLLDGVDLALKSDDSQKKHARTLADFAKVIPWKMLLQKACSLVLKRYRVGDPGVTLDRSTPIEPLTYALNPLVFKNKTTILYGDGGLGKSTLALLVAMLVSLGLSVAGLRAILGKILYLDYEDSSDVHARRLQAIQSGHPELMNASVDYQRCVEPLARIVAPLVRQIQDKGITFLVVDSLLAATGGDSSAEATTKVFAALRTLNVSTLMLGHVPKFIGEGQGHPTVYGSVFNQNFARSVWEVKKEQEVGENGMILGLFNRKSNLSRLHPPIGLQVTQDHDAIRYEPFDLAKAGALAESLPLPSRIRNFLESDGLPYSSKDIAAELGAKVETIKAVLSKHKGHKWQMVGEGRDAKWTVLSQGKGRA